MRVGIYSKLNDLIKLCRSIFKFVVTMVWGWLYLHKEFIICFNRVILQRQRR